ncbi:polycomb protein eed-like [Pomacea canaliculata]|uniref:polycomb protein eed-like n=1 Tax=Pomacea canaliculata TaxID=400727 RepID=UPI000D731118|nr:polycomb protein eed-like [Pomacea canaliculata]
MSDSEESMILLSKRQRLSTSITVDRSEDELDDLSSTASTREEESSRSDTPTFRRGFRWSKQPKKCKLQYKCTNFIKENHGQPLFGVQINLNCSESDPVIFATVGHNRVTVYECQDGGRIKLLHSYSDPSSDENFYCCAWSFDPVNGQPLLAAAGLRGIIRILSLSAMQCIRHFVGHGNAVNELKFHPRNCSLLLSVSKDHTLRMWNVHSGVCVLILGGVDGHRDEVLSADFNLSGTKIVSCGMDHSLKLWHLDTEEINSIISLSSTYNTKNSRPFPTWVNHFPDFSTRDIHRNYVDCTRWLGNLILSKSCENCIICWKPGSLEGSDANISINGGSKTDDSVSILHRFDYRECEIWYMRFCLDYQQKIMALGNQVGRIFLWDLDVDDPSQTKCTKLTHQKCNTAIRQIAISKDSSTLIAVSDDATVWRWDQMKYS